MTEQIHNVLVVEDEEAVRSMLELSLKFAGYHVQTANDGLEALEEMKQQQFDVVVTDYQMPRMDGLQFLSLSKILWPHTPVVLISGNQSDEVADVAMRGGAYTWLHKPYERAVLLQILQIAIQHSVQKHTHLVTSHCANEAQAGWNSGPTSHPDQFDNTR